MINPNVNHYTAADSMSQIGTYFDTIDNCINTGDTNKRYSLMENSNYSVGEATANKYVSFVISPTTDNTADVKSGFITTTLHATITTTGGITKYVEDSKLNTLKTWVGFYDAFNAVEKYEILHNGQTIYTQNDAITEGIITGNTISENSKRSDFYSQVRHKDIWNNANATRCGATVDWSDGVKSKGVDIPIKIDLRRFLPLSNVKYLPAFIGKLELRILFSTSGLVWTHIDPRAPFKGDFKRLSTIAFPEVSCEFIPMGEIGKQITAESIDATTKIIKLDTQNCVFDVMNDYRFKDLAVYLPNFGISDAVYRSLEARYTQIPLTFPTQTLHVSDMESALKGTEKSQKYTYTPRFVDSIFLLFPLNSHYKTVFKNPGFTDFLLKAGSFGSVPDTSLSFTSSIGVDPKLIEYTQQACNLNEDTAGFRKDVIRSLTNKFTSLTTGNYSDDATHFFVGFKCEPQECFQQGMTANSPIDFTIRIKQTADSYYNKNVDVPPRICFLNDRTLSFQLRADNGPPIASLDASDITSPIE